MISKRKAYIILTIIVVAVVMYCYNPFVLFFQNDDFLHVLLSRQGVLFQQNSFRPVCDISVMLDYKIWQLNAVGYHATNLLLHVFCSVLVYLFIKKIFAIFFNEADNKEIAFLTALLFFAYPFHSEAVFWVLGRSAILAAVFSLLFFLYYINSASTLRSIASFIFFVLALLTYEASWLLIAFVWLLHFIRQKKNLKQSIRLPSLLSVAFIIYLCLRFITIHELAGEYEAGNMLHLNIQKLLYNAATLAGRSALPDSSKNLLQIFTSVVLLVFIVISFFRMQNGIRKNMIILVCLFICLLLPYLSVGISTNGTEGERFIYMPSIIWCTMLAYCIYSWKKGWLRLSVAAMSILLFASVLYSHNLNYKTAGNITKTTVAAINKLKSNSSLYFANVPQEQYGALIFRKGLQQAALLFTQPLLTHQINICSYADSSRNYIMPYQTKFVKNISANRFCNSQSKQESIYFLYMDSILVLKK